MYLLHKALPCPYRYKNTVSFICLQENVFFMLYHSESLRLSIWMLCAVKHVTGNKKINVYFSVIFPSARFVCSTATNYIQIMWCRVSAQHLPGPSNCDIFSSKASYSSFHNPKAYMIMGHVAEKEMDRMTMLRTRPYTNASYIICNLH